MIKTNAKEKAVEKALIKRAVGYDIEEITQEYGIDAETKEEFLTKKKVSIRHFAPDISAIKILLACYNILTENELENLTDEELIKERDFLLEKLKLDEKSIKGKNNEKSKKRKKQ